MADKGAKLEQLFSDKLPPLSNIDTSMGNNSGEGLKWIAHVLEHTGLERPLCQLTVVIGHLCRCQLLQVLDFE